MDQEPEEARPWGMESGQGPDFEGSQTPTEEAESLAPAEDMMSLMESEESGFRSLRRGSTIKGVVVSVQEDAVLVDVGTKSEGLISREELADQGEEPPSLTYGQEVLVQVLETESSQGPILSLKRARREQAWIDMEAFVTSGEVITAPVVDHNRGGALVDIHGLRGFIPVSQLVSLPPASASSAEGEETADRLAQLHGRRLNLKVLEASRRGNRLVLSERAAEQKDRERRRQEILAELAPGQIRRGRVRNVTSFGAFVDIGGVDGLVHVSEMSYERGQEPRNLVEPGQEVDVYVLDIRADDQKISLSMKKAAADPWDTIDQRLQPGQVVDCIVRRLAKFGAFAQVEPGVEGLIHITELSEVTPRDAGQVVHEGQQVQAKIIHVDRANRRLGLSLRQMTTMAPAERNMTADEWHQEQSQAAEPMPSAFEALSGLFDEAPEEVPEEAEAEMPAEEAKPKKARRTKKTAAAEADESPQEGGTSAEGPEIALAPEANAAEDQIAEKIEQRDPEEEAPEKKKATRRKSSKTAEARAENVEATGDQSEEAGQEQSDTDVGAARSADGAQEDGGSGNATSDNPQQAVEALPQPA